MIRQNNGVRASGIVIAALLLAFPAASRAQDDGANNLMPAQIQAGFDIYSQNCSACHGPRMLSPEAFDLRTFPRDQQARFITSVTKGKSSMPPWGGLLSTEDIENLGAYVVAGEKP